MLKRGFGALFIIGIVNYFPEKTSAEAPIIPASFFNLAGRTFILFFIGVSTLSAAFRLAALSMGLPNPATPPPIMNVQISKIFASEARE